MNIAVSRLALAASCGLCLSAAAQTVWSGAAQTTDWLNPANWSPAVVPGLGGGVNAAVLVDPPSPTIIQLTTAPDIVSLSGYRAPSPLVTTRVVDTDMQIQSVLDQAGQFLIEAGPFRSRVHFRGTDIAGGGEIGLDGGAGRPERAMLFCHNYPAISAGTRIHGRGWLVGAVMNHGTITADRPGDVLNIDPESGSAFSLRNSGGVLSAVDGGTLVLGTFEVENGGGTILADGGTVSIRQGFDLFGGTLATAHGGQIVFNGTTFESGVSFAGNMVVPDGGFVRFNSDNLHPVVHNSGTIHAVNISGGANAAILNVRYSTTFTGGGAISLDGRTGQWHEAQLLDSGFQTVLTNAADHTIRGIGTLDASVTNQGKLRVGYPGDAPNSDQATILMANRALILTPTGILETPIARDGSAGILLCTQPQQLGGALRVVLEGDPLTAAVGSAWDVIIAPSLTGAFTGQTLPPLPAGRLWSGGIHHGEGVDTYRILITCTADFNTDGFVDFFDFDAFVNCFESNDCPFGKSADFNNDGFADFFDFDAFVEAFEAGC